MGLFGFGKKKSKKEAEPAVEPVDEDKVAAAEANAAAKAESAETVLAEPASEYQGRGEERGPWDVNDEDVPDYDDYLDLGAYYLPFLRGIQLRIKANRATQQVLGSTITFGSSSLEIEAFAAPKTLGLWDDVRGDLLEANKAASEVDGVFGTELKLPVNVKGGKTVNTRIVGVDGPRWMLRGIFSGKAAIDPDSPETEALNKFFAGIDVTDANRESWNQTLTNAREAGIPVALIDPKHAPEDELLYAVILHLNTGSADSGDTADTKPMTITDAVLTITRDEPHEREIKVTVS